MSEPLSTAGPVGTWVGGDGPDSGESDPRVVRALCEYRAAVEAGHRPGRQAFLARYPEVAGELAACLEGLEFVQAAAREVRGLVAPAGSAPAAQGRDAPPAALGDFRILREAGRGGMGVVYEAEQVSLRRRVALKVLPFAAALDAKQLQRFRNEAEAAARLQHPHIVPVLAVGCEAGVPYYAMQFIDGRSLAEVVSATRDTTALPAAAGRPAAPRGPAADPGYFRQIARLLLQAAEALEYAHQCGVVHRDVKPGNLLVDARGHLWVTDFGLARVGGGSGVTATGDVIGTLHYMSPEQARARGVLLDHRTDIYSLGATAYELLTLRPPFDGEDRTDLLRRIAADEPRRPRRVNPRVPRDLETVVARAMEKDPADRYATAQELADDLRRFLEDKPVRARRATPWHVAAKWARRHRPVVAAAAAALAVVLAVLAGAVVHLSAANQALRDEQAKTEKERTTALRNEARAERAAEAAIKALHRVTLEVADDRLKKDPLWGKKAEQFLDDTVQICRDLAGMDGASINLRLNAASGFCRAAQAYTELGRGEKAKAALGEGLGYFRRLTEDAPDDFAVRVNLANGHRQFGVLLRWLGEGPAAAEQFRLALAAWDHPRPMTPCPYQASEAHDNLGDLCTEVGDDAGAREHFRKTVAQRERLCETFGDSGGVGRQLVQDHVRLAHYLGRAGDRPGAERHFRRALEVAERLTREYPGEPENGWMLGDCCRALGDFAGPSDPAAAAAYYGRALAVLPGLVAAHPGLAGARQLLAEVHAALGGITPAGADRDGHFRAARDLLTALAADLPDGSPGPGNPGQNQNALAWFLVSCPDPQFRDPVRAVEVALRAVEQAPKQPDYLNTLGVACYRAGDPEDAVVALERAAASRAGGGDALDLFFLAMARRELGDAAGAGRSYADALAWLARFPGGRTAEIDQARAEAEVVLGPLAREKSADRRPPGPVRAPAAAVD